MIKRFKSFTEARDYAATKVRHHPNWRVDLRNLDGEGQGEEWVIVLDPESDLLLEGEATERDRAETMRAMREDVYRWTAEAMRGCSHIAEVDSHAQQFAGWMVERVKEQQSGLAWTGPVYAAMIIDHLNGSSLRSAFLMALIPTEIEG